MALHLSAKSKLRRLNINIMSSKCMLQKERDYINYYLPHTATIVTKTIDPTAPQLIYEKVSVNCKTDPQWAIPTFHACFGVQLS